jgi:hypothetical protein
VRIRFRKPRDAAPQPAAAGPAGADDAAKAKPPAGSRPAGNAQAAGGGPSGDAAGAARPAASTPAASKASADPEARIDGLRAWLAQLDRRLGIRTYIGAALAVVALGGAAVALVLTLSLRQDAATNSDLDSLRDQVSGVEQSATQAAQSGVRSLNQRLADLESEVDRLSTDQTTTKRELKVIQDDIKELRSQVSSGSQSGTGALGGSAATGTGTGTGATSP